MSRLNTISAELQTLGSSLAHAPATSPYPVPTGYFDGLAAQVLAHVKALESVDATEELSQLSPFLASISRNIPYAIPRDYFETLEIPIGVTLDKEGFADELERLSPSLAGLKKQVPYSAPEGYFENLSVPAGRSVAASVIPLARRRWFRYAAAAVVTGFVVISGFLFLQGKGDAISPATASHAWVEKNLKQVSTDAISNFVEQAEEDRPVTAQLNPSDEVKQLMSNVSDKEIQDFLNDTQSADIDGDDDAILN